jgi:tetratricopeptide (TPR) repeat protein
VLFLDYNQAITINPNYAQAYYNRGIVRNELGDKPGAIDDYTQAIKFNPNLAQAYGNRAYVYYQLGDKQKAREDLQRAAQLFKAQGNTAAYEKAMALLKQL